MENPLDGSFNGPLYNISSGLLAPDEVCSDLLTARTTGENEFHDSVKTRLQTNDVGFFDKLPKTQAENVKLLKEEKKTIAVKDNEIIYELTGTSWPGYRGALPSTFSCPDSGRRRPRIHRRRVVLPHPLGPSKEYLGSSKRRLTHTHAYPRNTVGSGLHAF